MKVKICGVNSQAAFDAAAESGADWVGFVFFARSPRYVTATEAAGLARGGGPDRVGLFVDPTDADIASVLDRLALHALQLYAPPDRCAAVASRFALPVWRAVAVGTQADLPQPDVSAAWVIEPRPPADADRPGGNAVTLDWSLLHGWRSAKPWLLAGGLTPGNVAHAIAQSGAMAVDVSSGVETAPGVKSPALIAAFILAAWSSKEAVLF